MISVIVPAYNEEESLESFYKELIEVIPILDKTYEIIFIDDGSTDSTLKILKKLAEKDKTIKIFSFRRNYGKAEALNLGFQKAKGDYVFTMDADLEDKPSQMPKLLNKIKEGWDGVSGWRKNRKHSIFRVLSSNLSNFIIGKIWGLNLHDYNCGFKVLTNEAAKSLQLYGGLYRFMSVLAHQKGFKITEVIVEHQNRKYGKSKYGFFKLWKDLPDLFSMLFLSKYGKRPLHFFGLVGSAIFLIGFIILIYLWIIQLQGYSIGRRPLLFVGFFAILGGLQIIFTGFLADLMINLQSKTREEETDKERFNLKYIKY